jgi:hypothetical protein
MAALKKQECSPAHGNFLRKLLGKFYGENFEQQMLSKSVNASQSMVVFQFMYVKKHKKFPL